jgi:hypothetical protein
MSLNPVQGCSESGADSGSIPNRQGASKENRQWRFCRRIAVAENRFPLFRAML